MNTFERELRKLFEYDTAMTDTKFIGRSCYGRVSDSLRARIDFVTCGRGDRYEALKTTIINVSEGTVDHSLLRFNEFIGPNYGSNDAFKASTPYLWTYNGETEWYGYKPTKNDYNQILSKVNDYLDMFRPPEQSQGQSMVMQ